MIRHSISIICTPVVARINRDYLKMGIEYIFLCSALLISHLLLSSNPSDTSSSRPPVILNSNPFSSLSPLMSWLFFLSSNIACPPNLHLYPIAVLMPQVFDFPISSKATALLASYPKLSYPIINPSSPLTLQFRYQSIPLCMFDLSSALPSPNFLLCNLVTNARNLQILHVWKSGIDTQDL